MKKEKKNSKEIGDLENKIAELTLGWQRTQADFINFKNKTAKERVDLIKSANADFMSRILPVLDNFSLAAKHMPNDLADNTWAVGIKHIEKQLESVLFLEGLEKIKAEGEHFDPALHESIGEVESDKPDGTIVDEVSPGYILNNCVLRPAKVRISKGKQKSNPSD